MAGKGNPALRMALIRNIHSWIGMFIAPSVLFFAVTGALQLFSLHESHGDYHPPALVEKLGVLHKDQKFELKARRPSPPAAAAKAGEPATPAAREGAHDADEDADHDHDHAAPAPAKATAAGPAAKPADDDEKGPPLKVVALKWVFLSVSLGLIVSTVLGVWMALQPHRRKPSTLVLLAAGTVIPALLALL